MEKMPFPDFPLADTSDREHLDYDDEEADKMAEDTKKALDEQPAALDAAAESLEREINLIGIKMGVFGKGGDFFLDNGFPIELWEKYEETRRKALAKATAKALHLEDETPLMYAATRTEEQERVMLEISGREQVSRMKRYLKSYYFISLGVFIDAFAEALNVAREEIYNHAEWDDISDAAAYLNRYFYALHKEINPADEAALTDKQRGEIAGIVRALIAYKQEKGGGYFENIASCFRLKGQAEKITEITQADFFGLPLSKIWSNQGIISAEGAEGREINVGKKTSSGAVIVKASISGKDGEPLNIDEVQKGVQRAIGNLVYEAGGKTALPIIVTPQQIYRAFARLPRETTVTDAQAEEMEKAMDVLMYAPVNLNFTAQLERHKHIKQVPDYDYQGEQAGKLGGTLIPAQKLEAENRNGLRNVAYKIYDVPVLYMYSRAINQLAWVPNTLLTGAGKAPVKAAKKAEAQGTARGVAVKENVLSRVYRMIERQKRKEIFTPTIKVDDVAEDCGIILTEKTRRTLRKNIGLYLEELKAQKKIKGYEETKSGRGIVGYTVIP